MNPQPIHIVPEQVVQVEAEAAVEKPVEEVAIPGKPLSPEQVQATDEAFTESSSASAGLIGAWGTGMLMHDMMVESVGKRDDEEETSDPKKPRTEEDEPDES